MPSKSEHPGVAMPLKLSRRWRRCCPAPRRPRRRQFPRVRWTFLGWDRQKFCPEQSYTVGKGPYSLACDNVMVRPNCGPGAIFAEIENAGIAPRNGVRTARDGGVDARSQSG